MTAWPKPPEDTPEIRDRLHQAFCETDSQPYILKLIERGADPFKCNDDGFNAFALARKHGYPESFCVQMEEVFSRWLRPLNATTSIYITQDAHSFIDTLEEQGWQVWCKGTGQLGALPCP
ncbi:hypothetical protein [Marinospirillum perlucidum]|uniref:hypothetical protein n=1 Tax=Marinospirillum perlucidum TaxID=1982602 RepID=UPI000DF3CEB7|nr:hypothetical protein [Marinospirillum perlucidum]